MKDFQAIRHNTVQDQLQHAEPGTVSIGGWLGNRLQQSLDNRVMVQDIGRIITPFRTRFEDDAGDWRGEYWGKWFTSAALGYAYEPSPEHLKVLEKGVAALLATQTEDGYIGTYKDDHHLGVWDIWGRKYTLLGLLAYYDLTGDQKVLDAAVAHADCLLREAPPGKVNLSETGHEALKGLPSSSILEPVVKLYQRTGEQRFLDFARNIVADWSQPSIYFAEGSRLIEQALQGVPPEQIGSRKAYEMMSCYEGLCELYRVTGDRQYLDSVIAFANSIESHELMIHGSGSNQELWCDGSEFQTEALEKPTETCVTMSWIKLCDQLLQLTGDPHWADRLEESLYNALLSAMTPDGSWWAYFSPLAGQRVPSHFQHKDVEMSCCAANGPRALLLAPKWAVMHRDDALYLNLYAAGSSRHVLADGTAVVVRQVTDYPESGKVRILVEPAKDRQFTLKLRIPAWSSRTTLSVNGEPVAVRAGSYAEIARLWRTGDRVELEFDMRGRAIPAPSGAPEYAIMRGPVLLALDNRITPPQDLAVRLVKDADGYVELTPLAGKPDSVWMAFEAPFEVRPTHYFNHHQIKLALCDYASAGNEWSNENLLRVWLPQPLFLRHAYPDGMWKIMYPGYDAVPRMPSQSASTQEDWQ